MQARPDDDDGIKYTNRYHSPCKSENIMDQTSSVIWSKHLQMVHNDNTTKLIVQIFSKLHFKGK